MRRIGLLGITLTAVASLVSGLIAASPASAADPDLVRFDGPIVIESIHPSVANDPEVRAQVEELRAKRPDRDQATNVPEGRAGANGGLVVSFAANVPADVRAVVNAATAQWDAALATTIPVVIDFFWECFNSPGLLGYAGPTDVYQQASLPSSDVFPAALAHTLSGNDLNGGKAEVEVALNAELAGANSCGFATDTWYIGTTGAPGGSKIDLYSVVLHEIAHGLGFLGSAWDIDGLGGGQAEISSPPYVFDRHVHSGSTPLLSTANPNSHLDNNDLHFDLGGGKMHKLFAPRTFQNGSSFSHFHTSFGQGDPGQLMTPSLGNGEVRRALDAAVLSVLGQQGWGIVPRGVTPELTSVETAAGAVSVSWDSKLENYGVAPASYEISLRSSNSTVAVSSVSGASNSVTIGQLNNGQQYTLRVTPIDDRGRATAAETTVTLPAIPNQPTLVQSNGIGLARTISWQASVPSGGPPLSYHVQYLNIDSGSWNTVGTTATTSIKTAPLPTGRYQFRVRASNSNGDSPFNYSTVIGVGEELVRPLPLDGQVGRLYSAYFLRQPDTTGFDYWRQERALGRPLSSISSAFEHSPEFQRTYGSLSDTEFVELIYRNVVGRAPDSAGRVFWLRYLAAGNSRGSLMIGFSESDEYTGRTGTVSPSQEDEGAIYRLYLAFFQRPPDAAGLSYWVDQLQSGKSLSKIADSFVESSEFKTQYRSLTDHRFVALAYNNVLIRNPDASGYAFWEAKLSGGTSRGNMMIGLSESPEFIVRTGSLP